MKAFESLALVRPATLHCQTVRMAVRRQNKKNKIENAENQPNYRETTQ